MFKRKFSFNLWLLLKTLDFFFLETNMLLLSKTKKNPKKQQNEVFPTLNNKNCSSEFFYQSVFDLGICFVDQNQFELNFLVHVVKNFRY